MPDVVRANISIEERISQLERQLAEMRGKVAGLQSPTKDWQRTVGMMPDDEISRSAARLGREWRDHANEE